MHWAIKGNLWGAWRVCGKAGELGREDSVGGGGAREAATGTDGLIG